MPGVGYSLKGGPRPRPRRPRLPSPALTLAIAFALAAPAPSPSPYPCRARTALNMCRGHTPSPWHLLPLPTPLTTPHPPFPPWLDTWTWTATKCHARYRARIAYSRRRDTKLFLFRPDGHLSRNLDSSRTDFGNSTITVCRTCERQMQKKGRRYTLQG